MGQEILDVLGTTFWMVLGIIAIFVLYLAVSGLCFFIHNMYSKGP